MKVSGQSVGEGGGLLAPGIYHLVIDSCEEHTSKEGNGSFKAEITVLDGTVPGQTGKRLMFNYFGGSKLFELAAAVGLTDKVTGQPFTPAKLAEYRKLVKAKQPVPDCDFEPADAVACTFVGEVVMGKPKEGTGQRYPELGFKIMSPFSDEAKDVPKDQAYLGGPSEGGIAGSPLD